MSLYTDGRRGRSTGSVGSRSFRSLGEQISQVSQSLEGAQLHETSSMAQPSSPQREASAWVVFTSVAARLNDAPSCFRERCFVSGAQVTDHVTLHSTLIEHALVIVKSTVVSPLSF